MRAWVHHLDGIENPYEYDCPECDGEFEPGALYCNECPYDPRRVWDGLKDAHEGFPEIDELFPAIQRVMQLHGDVEAFGRTLNQPDEWEVVGLRILTDEIAKLERSKMKQMEGEAERMKSKAGSHV